MFRRCQRVGFLVAIGWFLWAAIALGEERDEEALRAVLAAAEDELSLVEERLRRGEEEVRWQERLEKRLGRQAELGEPGQGWVREWVMFSVERAVTTAEGATLLERQGTLREEREVLSALLIEEIERGSGVDDEDRERIAEAESAREAARQAAEMARLREEQARDEETRRLLARQRELAEEVVSLTEAQTERIREISDARRESAELFLTRRNRLDEAIHTPDQGLRDRSLDEAAEFRRIARDERRSSRHELVTAEALVAEARGTLDAASDEEHRLRAELGPAAELSELGRHRMAVARMERELAERQVMMAQDLSAETRRRHQLLEERTRYFDDAMRSLYELSSPEARRRVTSPFSDQNWADLRAGLVVMWVDLQGAVRARARQAQQLPSAVRSATFWGWALGIGWRLLLLGALLWWLRRQGPKTLRRWVGELLQRPRWRRHAGGVILGAQVLQGITWPLVAWGGVVWMVAYLAPLIPELQYLHWVVAPVILYWVAMEVIRGVVATGGSKSRVDRPVEEQVAALRTKTLEAALTEGSRRRQSVARLLRSTRWLVVAGLAMWVAPKVAWEIFGPSPGWLIVVRAMQVLLGATVYLVLSWWRDPIAKVFRRHTGGRLPRVVSLVDRWKDGPLGVFVIGLASVAVVVLEGVALARRWITTSEVHRRVSNFLFRKKIEIQQKTRESQTDAGVPEQEVPDEYRRAFDVRPLWDEEFVLDRREITGRLCDEYRRFDDGGRQGSVALVGEAGIGKTTVLNQLVRHGSFSGPPMVYLSFCEKMIDQETMIRFLAEVFGICDEGEPLPGSEDLVERIRGLPRRTILLDGCQQLFLRHIRGFRAIDLLLEVVQLTDDCHFWVLTFNHFGWNFLNRVRPRGHYFGKVVTMKAWTEEEVRALVMGRDGMVDLSISFANMVVAQEGADQSYEVIRTSNGYFRLLHEFARGNPTIAQVFWLRSLHLDRLGELQVGLFRRPPYQVLQDLGDPYLFTLAAIAQHGGLRAPEVGRIINTDVGQCATMMNFLHEEKIIEINDRTGLAQLSPLYFRTVLQQLSGSNFLYE